MGDFPIQAIVVPLLGIAVAIFFMVTQRKRLQQQAEQYQQYTVQALAQRLGLRIVKGDPTFNLFIRQASHQGSARVTDGRPRHVEVVLEGQSQGLPVQLRYIHRVEQKSDIGTVETKTWDRCTFTAQARQSFPPFEVASRSAPMGTIAREQNLTELATGNPAVDTAFLVATQEPGMAQLLGSMLEGFATFQTAGVHLIGDGQTVAFVMHEKKPPLLANALYFAEELASRVVDVATRVGG